MIMSLWRTTCLSLLLLGVADVPASQKKDNKVPPISDDSVRLYCLELAKDPLNRSAPGYSRLILRYAMEKPNAHIGVGDDELRWIGVGGKEEYVLLLLGGYLAGNIQSQLNSGVQRDDRYSGVLTLFQVYRSLQSKDKEFKINAIDNLLALHQEGRLIGYLQQLDEKKPAKMTPEAKELIERLRQRL
jgi:hypothetical protein